MAYCVKAEILVKENESEKALEVLNNLKNFIAYDDSFA